MTAIQITREVLLSGGVFKVNVPAAHRVNGKASYLYQIDAVAPSGRFDASWFVKFLPGTRPLYMGKLNDFTGQVETTSASKFADDSHEMKLLNRILRRVWGGEFSAIIKAGFTVDVLESRWLEAQTQPVYQPVQPGDEMEQLFPEIARHGQYFAHENNDGEHDMELYLENLEEQREEELRRDEENNRPAAPPAKLSAGIDEALLRRILPSGREPWQR